VLDLIVKGLRTAGETGLTEEELLEAKEQLKGQIMLSLESTSGRMMRLGRGELTLGCVLSPDEIIRRINAVTGEQVHHVAEALLLPGPSLFSAVGSEPDALNLAAYGFVEVSHG
jgi:predicted Zn-dependent peptidase